MNRDHKQVWSRCLAIIRDNLPPVSFRTWFEPIVPLNLDNNILTIQVPSPFFYEYLEEQFIDLLRKTIRKEIGMDAKLEYSILVENNNIVNSKPLTVKYPGQSKDIPKNKPVSMPLSERAEIKNPFIIPGIKKIHVDPQLNPNNSFHNFIEGDCNKLGLSAGKAVADNPGGTPFNPLMVYGESGLGKTHLIQAIGIAVKEKHPNKIVLYVPANKFQTQYAEATRNNNKNDFIHFYQMIDILIIDDVQDLAGKEKTQNAFFHLFNHLHQSNKQLILSSDKSPVELRGIEERLLSRFKWGLTADLQRPDFETRKAILKNKAYKDGIVISPEIIDYIAENIHSNIRELEGALVSLLARATLTKREVTLDLAKHMLQKLVRKPKREVSVELIEKVVCDYFNMGVDAIHSNTRKREIVQARQIAMYFSKNLTKSSLAAIGSKIGGKDHATVLHACKTVNNLIDTDKRFKIYIDEIGQKLRV